MPLTNTDKKRLAQSDRETKARARAWRDFALDWHDANE